MDKQNENVKYKDSNWHRDNTKYKVCSGGTKIPPQNNDNDNGNDESESDKSCCDDAPYDDTNKQL